MTPAITIILADTTNFIMGSKDVNESGTEVKTENDHGACNAWNNGCAKPSLWNTEDENYQN
ncbi:MAG: hypothetical protein HXO26_08085 [Prevotella sp.]|nr:hypothetical protein [Prevotella sp.]